MRRHGWQHLALARHVGVPASLVLLVVTVDLLAGLSIVYGLLCAVPLVCSAISGPRLVAGWGALCLALQVGIGFKDQAYVPDELAAQLFRIAFTLLTTLIAVALSSRRLAREEHIRAISAVAVAAQQSILRPVPDRVGRFGFAVQYQAAAAFAQVGGDLYDVVPVEGGALVILGDVRGKGWPAVRLATDVLGAFRYVAVESGPDAGRPGEVLRALDRMVSWREEAEEFVTAVVVRLSERGPLVVANAGHHPPLLVRDGAATPVAAPAARLPLGMAWGLGPGEAAVPLPELEVPVRRGDTLLLYTDGLVEARRPLDGEFFPLEDVAGPVLGGGSPTESLARLRREVTRWTGGGLDDDAAMLAVSVT